MKKKRFDSSQIEEKYVSDTRRQAMHEGHFFVEHFTSNRHRLARLTVLLR